MQKSNNLHIDKLLDGFENAIVKISNLLAIEGRLDLRQIRELNDLYAQRDEAVNYLIGWSKSAEGKNCLVDNHNNISNRISQIIENDKKHLKNIETRLYELKSNLRKLVSNKSLLIYSKEK